MKLQEAMELAAVCGLTTVGEALDNVVIHAGNYFSYDEAHTEIAELVQEIIEAHGREGWRSAKIPQSLIDEENRKMDEYFAAQEEMYKENPGTDLPEF